MKIFILLLAAFLVSGCASTLQANFPKQITVAGEIYTIDDWRDIARIKHGAGSFKVKFRDGPYESIEADSKRPPLIGNTDIKDIGK